MLPDMKKLCEFLRGQCPLHSLDPSKFDLMADEIERLSKTSELPGLERALSMWHITSVRGLFGERLADLIAAVRENGTEALSVIDRFAMVVIESDATIRSLDWDVCGLQLGSHLVHISSNPDRPVALVFIQRDGTWESIGYLSAPVAALAQAKYQELTDEARKRYRDA